MTRAAEIDAEWEQGEKERKARPLTPQTRRARAGRGRRPPPRHDLWRTRRLWLRLAQTRKENDK